MNHSADIRIILEKLDTPEFVGYLGATDSPEKRYTKMVGEDENPQDVVTLDIPLIIRLFEYAREDAKTDMDLHTLTEKLIELSVSGKTLSMDDYDALVGTKQLEEGNPLSRIQKFAESKRWFVGISAERSGLSPKENELRTESLKKSLSESGYGYKKSEGWWQGAKEVSFIVFASQEGSDAGKELVIESIKLGKKYGQDSIFFYNGDQGFVYGTNESGWPGMNKIEKVGKLAYNDEESEFQTELRPKSDKPLKTGRTEKSTARFTTK